MTEGHHPFHPALENEVFAGITIREYFAAMAMQGLCVGATNSESFEAIAYDAVGLADKLIEALNDK